MSRDNHEFDIDDILSEIKERKSREKGKERKTSPLPPVHIQRETESSETSEDSLYRTTFDELDRLEEQRAVEQKGAKQEFSESWQEIMNQSEEQKATPKATRDKVAPKAPPPRSATPPTKEKLVFEATPPEPGESFFDFQQETETEETPEFLSRETEPREATRTEGASGAFDFEAFDEIAPLGQSKRRARRPQESYTAPDAGVEPEDNPMDFSAPARSIADRAKVRERYADLARQRAQEPPARPPRSRLNFQVEQEPEYEVDFETVVEHTQQSAKPLSSPVPPEPYQDEEMVRSRSGRYATPVSATGKSLKIEDIRRMDFESVEGAGSRPQHIYYEDDAIDAYDDGSYVSLKEYRPTTDRVDVSRDIANTKMLSFLRTAGTGLLTFFLFYFSLAGSKKFWWLPLPRSMFPEPETMKNYLMACTVMIGLVLLINIRPIVISLYNLLRMRANSETLPSLAVIASFIQAIYAVRNPDLVDPNQLNLYYAIAALTMLFASIGRLSMLSRIQANFRVVSSKLPKKGVMAVESSGFCYDIAMEEGTTKPTISYAAKADFFTDFLSLSFSDRYDVGINRSVAPACLLGSLVIAFGTRFLVGDTFSALSALTAALVLCATLTVTFIESIPLGKLAKRLTPYGCMVSGNKAVETFCDTHSVILNDTDLFPQGSVTLHGMKAFPDGRIADAILDAASVLHELEGVLTPMAMDMIGGDETLLKKVDDVVFETGMGVSAWVDKKRVLIGNRRLMQNHGILLPNDTYERENPGNPPGNPIYICNSGEVSARFLVNYNIDEELAYQLDHLGHQNRHLIVYTTDPNINEQMIWETYGYPLELISILPQDLHQEYLEMASPQEQLPAEIVYTGGAANYVAAILGTVSTRASILSATVIQLLQILLGYGLVAFMAFMGYIGNLTIVQLLIFQVFWFVATIIVQQSRRS